MKKLIVVLVSFFILSSLNACTNNDQARIKSYSTNEQLDSVPNPNMVSGRSTDVHNLGAATNAMSDAARRVPGVQRATVYTNGATAYVRLTLNQSVKTTAQINDVKKQVYTNVKRKMPRFNVRVYTSKNKTMK